MKHKATGILIERSAPETKGTFTFQTFVLRTDAETKYPQEVQFQLSGKNVGMLDNAKIGETVEVSFSIQGRRWDGQNGVRYFVTLSAYDVLIMGSGNHPAPAPISGNNDDVPAGDLPF